MSLYERLWCLSNLISYFTNVQEDAMEKRMILAVLISVSFFTVTTLFGQPAGGGWAKNISLLKKGFPERSGESSDIWGWRDSQTGKDYVLVTINDNLSIVETTNPFDPHERAYIKGPGTVPLGTPDVEVYESGGNAYAYLARNSGGGYTAIVINLREALNPGGTREIDVNGSFNNFFVGKISAIPDKMTRGHTLTIAGGILYICPAHRTFAGPDSNKCYLRLLKN